MSHVGELLAAALGGRGGISPLLMWADFLPPNCSLCDSEYKVYYSGKPEVRDLSGTSELVPMLPLNQFMFENTF